MSAKPTIFFDLDGVLIDVTERHCRVHRDTLAVFGSCAVDVATYWRMKRDGTSLAARLAVSGNAHVAEAAYRHQFLERIESLDYLRADTLIGNVRELLVFLLKSRPVVLVTLRRHSDNLRRQLRWLGLTSLFTTVLSGRASDGKKDWEIKRDLVESSGLAASGSIIVGDTEVDVCAGKALRLITVAVCSGLRSKSRLQDQNPDYLLEDINQLSVLW